jgi:hypothetical protein
VQEDWIGAVFGEVCLLCSRLLCAYGDVGLMCFELV